MIWIRRLRFRDSTDSSESVKRSKTLKTLEITFENARGGANRAVVGETQRFGMFLFLEVCHPRLKASFDVPKNAESSGDEARGVRHPRNIS